MEKSGCHIREIVPSWGAAVLRPYLGLRYLLVGRAY